MEKEILTVVVPEAVICEAAFFGSSNRHHSVAVVTVVGSVIGSLQQPSRLRLDGRRTNRDRWILLERANGGMMMS